MSYTKFHAQFGEDEWIVKNLKLPEKGFFVDVGAAHPQYFSNTCHFERNGWEGLLIDPDPRNVSNLINGRMATVVPFAVTNNDYEIVILNMTNSPAISTLTDTSDNPRYDRPIKVIGLKLDTLLSIYEVKSIDLMSIDVEGKEKEVLESFTIEKWKPKVIVIEYISVFGGNRSGGIIKLIPEKLYKKVHTTQSNFIYALNA